MHENYDFYQKCKQRMRNRGLFTADQNLRNDARGTRQNPNGNRRGLECPEERDYYPYWAPNPWRDIAIITDNAERCPYYVAESQNAKPRGECVTVADYAAPAALTTLDNWQKCPMAFLEDKYDPARRKQDGIWFNNQYSCELHGHKWVPAWFSLDHPASQALAIPT